MRPTARVAHAERHRADRGAWLRASVLGANDGIVSTACLVLGVAAADSSAAVVFTAGLAGLVGGSLSMAAGEYVSVSSQRDLEEADLARERDELRTMPDRELAELTRLYIARGVPQELARDVAVALTAHDGLAAHAREELQLDVQHLARPLQAAVSSAVSFALGAALPLGAMTVAAADHRLLVTATTATAALGALGALSARLGGAPMGPAVSRVTLGGLAAMGLTMVVGALFGSGA